MSEIYNSIHSLKSRTLVDFFLVCIDFFTDRRFNWKLEIYKYHECFKSIISVDDNFLEL